MGDEAAHQGFEEVFLLDASVGNSLLDVASMTGVKVIDRISPPTLVSPQIDAKVAHQANCLFRVT